MIPRREREELVVYGEKYMKVVLESTIQSSERKIKFYGRTYQYFSNIAKNGLGSKEQAEAQGATPEQKAIIGNKTWFGPPFNEAMSIVRVYTLGLQYARDLQQDPETRERGIKLEHDEEKLFQMQCSLYNVDWQNLKLNL